MLIYVRKKNISGIIEKLRNDMDTEQPESQQGTIMDDDLKWSLISVYQHSSGELIEVSHVGLDLHVP